MISMYMKTIKYHSALVIVSDDRVNILGFRKGSS
jgi:hypothetical protein